MTIYILKQDYQTTKGIIPKGTELYSCGHWYQNIGFSTKFAASYIENEKYKFEKKELIISAKTMGVIPEFIWVEQRVKELQDAFEITNFTDCEAWIEEWNRHVNWLMNRKK